MALTVPLSGLVKYNEHCKHLLSNYFTVCSNRSDVQHMLIVHLGRSTSLRVAPRAVGTDSGMSGGCTPECHRGTLVGMLGTPNAVMDCQVKDCTVKCY